VKVDPALLRLVTGWLKKRWPKNKNEVKIDLLPFQSQISCSSG
jgi:hypothetical protein